MSEITITIENDDGTVSTHTYPWPDDRSLLGNGDFVAMFVAAAEAEHELNEPFERKRNG